MDVIYLEAEFGIDFQTLKMNISNKKKSVTNNSFFGSNWRPIKKISTSVVSTENKDIVKIVM